MASEVEVVNNVYGSLLAIRCARYIQTTQLFSECVAPKCSVIFTSVACLLSKQLIHSSRFIFYRFVLCNLN